MTRARAWATATIMTTVSWSFHPYKPAKAFTTKHSWWLSLTEVIDWGQWESSVVMSVLWWRLTLVYRDERTMKQLSLWSLLLMLLLLLLLIMSRWWYCWEREHSFSDPLTPAEQHVRRKASVNIVDWCELVCLLTVWQRGFNGCLPTSFGNEWKPSWDSTHMPLWDR